MKKLLVAAAVAGLVGTANAQSAFEGFYGQVGVGYESISPEGNGASVNWGGTTYNFSQSFDQANSFNSTITAGYNFAVSKDFLLGIGAEYSPLNGSSANYSFSNASAGTVSGSYKKLNSYNLFLSPTVVIDKDKAAYFKVGYTGAAIKDNADGSTVNYTGYSLGLGYKQIISGGLYGFGEVNYANYGDKTQTQSGRSGSTNWSSTVSSGASSMNFMVGVGYRF